MSSILQKIWEESGDGVPEVADAVLLERRWLGDRAEGAVPRTQVEDSPGAWWCPTDTPWGECWIASWHETCSSCGQGPHPNAARASWDLPNDSEQFAYSFVGTNTEFLGKMHKSGEMNNPRPDQHMSSKCVRYFVIAVAFGRPVPAALERAITYFNRDDPDYATSILRWMKDNGWPETDGLGFSKAKFDTGILEGHQKNKNEEENEHFWTNTHPFTVI